MLTNLVFITELLSSQSVVFGSVLTSPPLTSLPFTTPRLWSCSKQIVSHGLIGDVLPPISSTLSPSSGVAVWKRRSVGAGPDEIINYIIGVKECSYVTKFSPSPNSDRYYFVLENRISLQMGLSPIKPDKWTEIKDIYNKSFWSEFQAIIWG